uniref:Preprotein translocase subunit G n=1 Tax=Gastroclonium compressum TaxID=1852973 RepID=A0A173G038_GASCM|nr:preprotein translocase subunit G [Coeloseira compressa]ANH09639.1 preprotein translocase subunit G [Coeloseira compressa]
MKIIWYLVSISTLSLILFYSPKMSNSTVFNDNQQISSITSESQKTLQMIISSFVLLFFVFTILISLFPYE